MSSSDAIVRRARWRDPHVRHSLAVALLGLAASGGVLFVLYLRRVLRVARHAPTVPARQDAAVLVFGKRLVRTRPCPELEARVARAATLLAPAPERTVLLLGGRTSDGPTEAEAALAMLKEHGVGEPTTILLEADSADTLENLRNARSLLGARTPVALVSNRYHLARCAALARGLGFEVHTCAAEAEFTLPLRQWPVYAREALLLLWLDVGARWAAWTRHPMLQRLR